VTGPAAAQLIAVSVVNCAPPLVSHGLTVAPKRRKDLINRTLSTAPIDPDIIKSMEVPESELDMGSI